MAKSLKRFIVILMAFLMLFATPVSIIAETIKDEADATAQAETDVAELNEEKTVEEGTLSSETVDSETAETVEEKTVDTEEVVAAVEADDDTEAAKEPVIPAAQAKQLSGVVEQMVKTLAAPAVMPVSDVPQTTAETMKEAEAPAAITAVEVLKADGSAYKMFKVGSWTAKQVGEEVEITFTTANTSYDKLYFGAVADENKTPVVQGTELTEGGWSFTFKVPASQKGTKQPVILGMTSGKWSDKELVLTIPAEVEAEAPAAITAVEVLKADGSAYKMFKVGDWTAKQVGEEVEITFTTANTSYDKLYFGAVADENKTPVVQGTELTEGGWSFTFKVPASQKGTKQPVVLGMTSGKWSDKELVLTIPAEVEAEAPAAITAVEVLKADGSAYKMFKVGSWTAKQVGEEVEITFTTANTSYDKLYFGAVADENKTPVVQGTELTEGGWSFTFKVPASQKGTKQPVVLGMTSGKWSDKELVLTIPTEVEAEQTPGEGTPEITPTPGESTPEITPTPGEGTTTPDTKPTPTPDTKPTPTPDTKPTPTPGTKPVPGKLEDGIYTATATTGAAMFKVVDCKLTVKNGKMTAVIALSGQGYDYLYMGSKEAAQNAAKKNLIPFVVQNINGEDKYTYTIPVSALDKELAVASHSSRNDMWFDRTITIDSASLVKISSGTTTKPDTKPTTKPTVTPTPTPTPEAGITDDKELEDMIESTKPGTVTDGTYKPSFGYKGGSGRVTLSCNSVVVSGGNAMATIVFASPNFTYMKVNGTKYYNQNKGGNSTFVVPVNLNGTTSVAAETTAMSVPYEVEYTLYIYVNGTDVSNIKTPTLADSEKKEDKTDKEKEELEEDALLEDGTQESGWGAFDSDQVKPSEKTEETEKAEKTELTLAEPTSSTSVGTVVFVVVIVIVLAAAAVLLWYVKKNTGAKRK